LVVQSRRTSKLLQFQCYYFEIP